MNKDTCSHGNPLNIGCLQCAKKKRFFKEVDRFAAFNDRSTPDYPEIVLGNEVITLFDELGFVLHKEREMILKMIEINQDKRS